MINIFNKDQKQGYTLVEALIYIAIFVIISLGIVSLIMSVLETNRKVSPMSALGRGAVSVLEVLTREIRGAVSVDTLNSVFATSTGSLWLNSLDADDNSRTVNIYLEAGQVLLAENGVDLGPLSPNETVVTDLSFDLATTSSQSLIKISLSLSAGSGTYAKNETFYSTVGLRTGN